MEKKTYIFFLFFILDYFMSSEYNLLYY